MFDLGFDFDTVVDRRDTMSIKYDFWRERGKPDGLISLWVADMDFKAPPCVLSALSKVVEHGVFGYSEVKSDYVGAINDWFGARYGFRFGEGTLVKTPGVVYALAAAVRAFTERGDGVMIQPPVYYPFRSVIVDNGRKLVPNPLVFDGHTYTVDFDDFERKIVDNGVKLFLLCNPHNPVGRSWRRGELKRMGDICLKHGVVVVSDEIHCDFVWGDDGHTVFGSLGDEYLCNSVICTAPTKSFNLAGLHVANTFIADSGLRRRFRAEMAGGGMSQLSVAGLTACKAAYEGGGEWLDALREYLCGNIDFVRGFLSKHIPNIKLVEPEATYLLWLDCRGLMLNDDELKRFVEDKARLWVDEGTMFGASDLNEGAGFIRINAACPRSVLERAFGQLEQAVENL